MKFLIVVAFLLLLGAVFWFFFGVAQINLGDPKSSVAPPSKLILEIHGRRVSFHTIPDHVGSPTDVEFASSVAIQLKSITVDGQDSEVYFASGTTAEGQPATLVRDGNTFSLSWMEVRSGRIFRHDVATGEQEGEVHHDVIEIANSTFEAGSGGSVQESTPCRARQPRSQAEATRRLIIDVVPHVRMRGFAGNVKFGVRFLEEATERLKGVEVVVRLQPSDPILPKHFGSLWRFAKINPKFVAGDLCELESQEVCDYFKTTFGRGPAPPHLVIFVSDHAGPDCGFSASIPSAKHQMRNYAVVSSRCAASGILHEAGHLLGLQHEFWWDPRLYTLAQADVVTSENVVSNRPYIWTEENSILGLRISSPRQVGTTMCRSCEEVFLTFSESAARCNGKRIGERRTKSDDVTVASRIAIELIAEQEIRLRWADDSCRINSALQCFPAGRPYVSFRENKWEPGDFLSSPASLPFSDPKVLLLTGFASQENGTAAYNASLSRHRLETAVSELRKQFPNATYQLCIIGSEMAPCSNEGKPLSSASDTQAVYVLEQTEFVGAPISVR